MLSLDSKMKEILKNPEACAILEEYTPGFAKNPSMKLVGNLTLKKLFSFPQCDEKIRENAEEIEARLKALGE